MSLDVVGCSNVPEVGEMRRAVASCRGLLKGGRKLEERECHK